MKIKINLKNKTKEFNNIFFKYCRDVEESKRIKPKNVIEYIYLKKRDIIFNESDDDYIRREMNKQKIMEKEFMIIPKMRTKYGSYNQKNNIKLDPKLKKEKFIESYFENKITQEMQSIKKDKSVKSLWKKKEYVNLPSIFTEEENRKYINRSLRKLNKIPKPKNINRILTENISLKKDNKGSISLKNIKNLHSSNFLEYMKNKNIEYSQLTDRNKSINNSSENGISNSYSSKVLLTLDSGVSKITKSGLNTSRNRELKRKSKELLNTLENIENDSSFIGDNLKYISFKIKKIRNLNEKRQITNKRKEE